jgi:glycosyltransferase involved in cell wall biosynthesis
MRLSIVIPFYNEADSLPELLPKLASVVSTLGHDVEVLLVDDCSSDGSTEIARDFARQNDAFRLLSLPARGGQTGALGHGIASAKGDYVLRMDADLQDDPADLPRFVEKIDEGYDMVVGLRASRNLPRTYRFASRSFDLLVGLLLDSPLHSFAASYICFRTDLVRVKLHPNDHRYLPLIAIRRGAEKTTEIIVNHYPRRFGQSKYSLAKKTMTAGPEALRFLARLYRGTYDQ